MTVGCALTEDRNAILKLWQLCFGDNEDYINAFLDYRFKPENTLIARENGEICSMLFLLDGGKIRISGEEFSSAYLYAACTHPDKRSRGIMGKLLKAAQTKCRDGGLDYICLVPAEDSLFEYYAKYGYKSAFEEKRFSLARRQLELIADRNAEVGELTTQDMLSVRTASLSSSDCFIWDAAATDYALRENLNAECKSAAAFAGGRCTAYALFDENEDGLVIRECAARRGGVPSLAEALIRSSKAQNFLFRLPLDFPLSADNFIVQYNAMLLPLNDAAETALRDIKNAYMGLTLG